MSKPVGCVLLVAAMASLAQADALSPSEIFVVQPQGTVDRAEPVTGRIPWCDGAPAVTAWEHDRLVRGLQNHPDFSPDSYFENLLEQMCLYANDRSMQQQATYIIQAAMNEDPQADQAGVVARMKRLIAASVAQRATAGREPSDEERFAFDERHLVPVPPAAGVATAKLAGQVPWCAGVTLDEKWDAGRIGRTAESRDGLVDAARQLCRRATDATWVRKATLVLQQWMNWTKQPQADAVASLHARAQSAKITAERKALCARLVVAPEQGGAARTYLEAYQRLFGCYDERYGETWQGNLHFQGDETGYWIDASATPSSELARMYWLFAATDKDARDLLAYAVTARDFAALTEAAIDRELATPLFGGGAYVRAVASESLAVLRWRQRQYVAAIDKLVKTDPVYARLLVDAPARGWAQYEKLAAAWPAELGHIATLDEQLARSAKSAAAGCAKVLLGDVQKVIRSYKTANLDELQRAIGRDPMAAMLLDALARCPDEHPRVLGRLAGRTYRGPRSFAYFAMLDTLSEVLADRPDLPLKVSTFYNRTGGADRTQDNLRYDDARSRGVVGRVTRKGPRVLVEFRQVSRMEPEVQCKDTRKITRIDWNGNLTYEKDCWTTGKLVKVDLTPAATEIDEHFATAIKPGVFTGIGAYGEVPYVKAKADAKTVLAFYGFAL